MTLDEAIKHAEEVAEEEEKQAIWLQSREGNPNYVNCVECAKEHRQLVEWLKDYKRLLEQEKALEDIKADVEQYSLLTRERVIGIIDKHISKKE